MAEPGLAALARDGLGPLAALPSPKGFRSSLPAPPGWVVGPLKDWLAWAP